MDEMPDDDNSAIFVSLHFHIVFSTRNQGPILTGNVKEQLWAFLGDIAREHRMRPWAIGGGADHVHIFCSIPATISMAEIVHAFKNESTAWIRETYPAFKTFAWQEGDLCVSVSESEINKLSRHIETQEKHHRKQTFKEEYIALLKENEIEYDPTDLWS